MMNIPSDNTTTLQNLKEQILDFNTKRDWNQAQKPRDLSISICLEAAELLELFQWEACNDTKTLKESSKYQALKEELSDVLIYCLSMANVMDIDVAQAIKQKMELNAQKYPVPFQEHS